MTYIKVFRNRVIYESSDGWVISYRSLLRFLKRYRWQTKIVNAIKIDQEKQTTA
jgi:hypothetical protein